MQSAVMLIVITRTNGLVDAGIFSISYAIAGLMLYIGEFGVRKYQASDVLEKSSFADYFTFRIFSCSAMVIVSGAYAAYGLIFGSYTMYKFMIIILVCLIKVVEAFADVFYGRYQQQRRLDVSAKTTVFRIAAGMAACMISLVITQNLLVSVFVWFVVSLITMSLSTLVVASEFCTIEYRFNFTAQKTIFLSCLPIFLGHFLLLYVGNAPKYAIDACMTEVDQAYYNFIFMPVFVIEMLANFIFNPVLVKLADAWHEKNYQVFNRMVLRQVGVIGILTVIVIAGAYLLGCPILSWLYNADVNPLRTELCILMIGGGMLALVGFFAVVVTVIRCQHRLIAGYIFVAIIARILSNYIVGNCGLMGAAILYTILIATLALFFMTVLLISIKTERTKRC